MIFRLMSAPIIIKLLAQTAFTPGDVGWVTQDGAVCTEDRPGVRLEGCSRIRAIEAVAAKTHGRFIEVGPPPDAEDVSYLFD